MDSNSKPEEEPVLPGPSGSGNPCVSGVTAEVDDEELDALLNDALNDFGKAPPETKAKQAGSSKANPEFNQVWSEEFIKEATAEFEKKMREYVNSANPGSLGADGSNDSFHKVVDAASKAALQDGDAGLEDTLNEAIKSLASHPEAFQNPMAFNENDLSKLMGTLGVGDEVDPSDMDDLLPFMSNMMQKLLSKDLLQPVLSDVVDRYPAWLADNREKISAADFDKYNKQYEYMKKICEEYANEKEDDSEEVKRQRFDYISDLMLKVQSSGSPPQELVGDMDPSDPSAGMFNPSLGGQCSLM